MPKNALFFLKKVVKIAAALRASLPNPQGRSQGVPPSQSKCCLSLIRNNNEEV